MLLAVYYWVMMHLGGLESNQEAKVALSYCLKQLLRYAGLLTRALQTSPMHHNSIVHAKEWINC